MNKYFFSISKRFFNRLRQVSKLISFLTIRDSFIFIKNRDISSTDLLFIHPKTLRYKVKLRNNRIDRNVVEYVFFDQFHIPPSNFILPRNATILDLGCNIGLTIAHFKSIYPDSRIIGFEMDKDNYDLAKFNTQLYSGVDIINKAVWKNKESVKYNKNIRSDGYNINSGINNEQSVTVEAITISEIIHEYGIKKIDFLKMDIEGAEKEIFNSDDLSWLKIVESLNIEMHLNNDESINPYIELLIDFGFNAWKDNKHWSSIMAVKSNVYLK